MRLPLRLIAGAAGVVLVLVIAGARIDWGRAARDAAERRALETYAKLAKAHVGKRTSETGVVKTLSPGLQEFVRGAKKAAPHSKVDSAIKVSVSVKDEAKGTVTTTVAGQPECVDEYHRFHVIIPSTGECSVQRHQLFTFQTVFIRDLTGKTRIAQTEFSEFDPETKEKIPSTGVDLKGEYTFMDEVAGHPPILHLRPVAGLDHRGAYAAGVEFLNLERTEKPILNRVTLSAMGYWRPKITPRAGVRLGYRFYGNLTAGAYVGAEFPSTGLVVGADVTVQIGR